MEEAAGWNLVLKARLGPWSSPSRTRWAGPAPTRPAVPSQGSSCSSAGPTSGTARSRSTGRRRGLRSTCPPPRACRRRPQADHGSRTQRNEWTQIKDRILTLLGAQPLPNAQNLDLRDAGTGFVAHEVGTLPMSDDHTGMVTPDLQVEGKAGLYVCDNSVFPTSPAANPSLTLSALALRLAEHLGSR